MNKKTQPPQTDQELIQVFADLFNAVEPETPEEIDAVLLEEGYDPDEVGLQMQAFAEQALAKSPLNWRVQAETQMQTKRMQFKHFKLSQQIPHTREGLVAAINNLRNQLGPRARLAQAHFRNLESASNEDLTSLLTDLQYLASEQKTQDEEAE